MIMAITPVGNQVYIHQATPVISQINQAIFQRFDMQAYLAGEIEKNKETEIAPVTEGQESHQINADGEGSAKEQYQALRDHHKKEDEGSEEAEEVEEISDEDESGEHGFYEDYKIEHLLDIKA